MSKRVDEERLWRVEALFSLTGRRLAGIITMYWREGHGFDEEQKGCEEVFLRSQAFL